jgi:hypothetical protein
MRIIKKVPETIKEKVTLDKIICDLCASESAHKNNWSSDGYQEDVVTIEHISGGVWPEGDCREKEVFDICPDCWELKVKPFFESLGLEPEVIVCEDEIK